MSYDKILLTTDGSEASKAALNEAVELAENCEAEIHVLYVVDTGVESQYESVNDLMSNTESSRKLEQVGEKALKSITVKLEEEAIQFEKSIVKGKPFQKINSFAEENNMDVIVMSTHGRSGLDRMLLGSVTEKVVRTSNIPVLTVRKN